MVMYFIKYINCALYGIISYPERYLDATDHGNTYIEISMSYVSDHATNIYCFNVRLICLSQESDDDNREYCPYLNLNM